MCIELYIDKILVFSQCEESKNITYDNSTSSNSTLKYTNFTLPLNYTYFPNYTRVNSTHDFLNYTNFTNTTNASEIPLFNGTYNTSYNLNNMTVIQVSRVPSTTP